MSHSQSLPKKLLKFQMISDTLDNGAPPFAINDILHSSVPQAASAQGTCDCSGQAAALKKRVSELEQDRAESQATIDRLSALLAASQAEAAALTARVSQLEQNGLEMRSMDSVASEEDPSRRLNALAKKLKSLQKMESKLQSERDLQRNETQRWQQYSEFLEEQLAAIESEVMELMHGQAQDSEQQEAEEEEPRKPNVTRQHRRKMKRRGASGGGSTSQRSDSSSVARLGQEDGAASANDGFPQAQFFVIDHEGPRFFLVLGRNAGKVSVSSLRAALKSFSPHYANVRIYHITAEVAATKEHVVQIWRDFSEGGHTFAFANELGKKFKESETKYQHYRELSSDLELLMVPGSQKAWIEIRPI